MRLIMRNKLKLKPVPIFLSLFLILSLAFTINSIYTTQDESNIAEHVYSHRGASGEEFEHTFEAYDLAIAYGSRYIEQDLVTSKDGTLYVSHDLSAKKATGKNSLYAEMTDKEIKQLRTPNGSPILSLQDIFDKYTDSITYLIELKENTQQTQLFTAIVKQNKLSKNIIVQASKIEPLDALSQTFPHMKKLLLVKEQAQLLKAVSYENVDIVSVHKSLMTKENLHLVRDKHKEFNVWTLDSTKEIKQAISLDVDSYFTNYTAKALTLEKIYR